VANFLFVLSKDDNQAAAQCFQFAQIAHSKGHRVGIFLKSWPRGPGFGLPLERAFSDSRC